jgi:hypothetical protein
MKTQVLTFRTLWGDETTREDGFFGNTRHVQRSASIEIAFNCRDLNQELFILR